MVNQRSNQGHTITLHTYNPNQCSYPVSTSYMLQFLRYCQHFKQDFIGQCHYGKVKGQIKVTPRSHHDVVHLHHLTNVPTKHQLPTRF